MPNLLANIVLYSWPLVTWFLFRKLRPGTALIATILLGYLFIPERVGYDPPLLPAINKYLLPAVCALVAMWIVQGKEVTTARNAARRQVAPIAADTEQASPHDRRGPKAKPHRSRITLVIPFILAGLMVNGLITWWTNQSPLYYATKVLPGIRPYDIGMIWSLMLSMLLPLLVASRYLRTPDAPINLLKLLAWTGLVYSFLVLFEVRMSPKINIELYGFFAHDWRQHLRNGYRPIVFLAHGLRVGIFLSIAVLAAATLARSNTDGHRWRWLALTIWLALCLAVSHNFGAAMITFALLPVILIAPVRVQFLLGMVIAGTVMLYPLARGSGLIPAERIVTAVASFAPERGESLNYRLQQEDALLSKANQKPVSGWGGWGRSRIFSEETGSSESVADGSWILIIGESGWIGYLGTFGLLCLPAIFAARRYKYYQMGTVEAGLVLCLSANLIDLIPNSSIVAPIMLMAGTMWGRLVQTSNQSSETQMAQRGKQHGRRPPTTRISPLPAGQSAKVAPSNT